ncbi:hypothetical protein MIR68_010561 [Amoeboaphelidium protococcarum]|nr:hypothetical protein MIR68_010561 [Amoeboaphelidium protococcarum]
MQQASGNPESLLQQYVSSGRLYKSDTPIVFTQFLQWAPPGANSDTDLLSQYYDEYKANYAQNSMKLFYQSQGQTEWFKDSYSQDGPYVQRREQQKLTIKSNLDQFILDLNDGKYDNVSFDASLSRSASEQVVASAKEDGEDGDDDANEGAVDEDEEMGEDKEMGTVDDTAASADVDKNADNQDPQDQSGDKQQAGDQQSIFLEYPPTVMLGSVHPNIGYQQLVNVFSSSPDFEHLIMGNASPYKAFHRCAFVILKIGADARAFCNQFNGSLLNVVDTTLNEANIFQGFVLGDSQSTDTAGGQQMDYELRMYPFNYRKYSQYKYYIDYSANDADRLRKDIEVAVELLRLQCLQNNVPVDSLLSVLLAKAQLENVSLEVLQSLEQNQLKFLLDLLITTLRKVFLVEYYAGACRVSSVQEQLLRFGEGYFRVQYEGGRQKDRWKLKVASLEKKLQMAGILQGPSEDQVNDLLQDYLRFKTVKVEASKFRCSVCGKMFKGNEFVEKHLNNKHQDVIEQYQQLIKMWTMYMCDPFKWTASDIQQSKGRAAHKNRQQSVHQQSMQQYQQYPYQQQPFQLQQQQQQYYQCYPQYTDYNMPQFTSQDLQQTVFGRLESFATADRDQFGVPLPHQVARQPYHQQQYQQGYHGSGAGARHNPYGGRGRGRGGRSRGNSSSGYGGRGGRGRDGQTTSTASGGRGGFRGRRGGRQLRSYRDLDSVQPTVGGTQQQDVELNYG